MIKIDHLSKKYNDNVVLDDISLEIKPVSYTHLTLPTNSLV